MTQSTLSSTAVLLQHTVTPATVAQLWVLKVWKALRFTDFKFSYLSATGPNSSTLGSTLTTSSDTNATPTTDTSGEILLSCHHSLNVLNSYASGSGETDNNVMGLTSSFMGLTSSSSVSAAETEFVTLHVSSTASSSSTSVPGLITTTVPSLLTPSETDETTAATVPGKRTANVKCSYQQFCT